MRFFIVLFALAGCSAEEESFDLETKLTPSIRESFSPCDGDPSGAWQTSSIVTGTSPDIQNVFCESIPLDLKFGIAGSAVFAENQVTFNYTLRGTYVSTVSESCLEAFDLRCAELQPPDMSRCAEVAGRCQCARSNFETREQSGDFSESGSGEFGTEFDFCVNGDLLDTRWRETRLDGETVEIFTRWVRYSD